MSKKGKANLEDVDLDEIIEEAVRVDDLELVKMLISRGADMDEILYKAVQYDSDDTVDFLLRQPEIDVTYVCLNNSTTTLEASFANVKNTKKLLQHPVFFWNIMVGLTRDTSSIIAFSYSYRLLGHSDKQPNK